MITEISLAYIIGFFFGAVFMDWYISNKSVVIELWKKN